METVLDQVSLRFFLNIKGTTFPSQSVYINPGTAGLCVEFLLNPSLLLSSGR